MSSIRRIAPRLLLILALAALGALACLLLVPGEIRRVEDYLVGFPDADAAAHRLRPMLLGGLCFVPALMAAVYSAGNIFDRYLLRQFFGIFGICLGALLLIWLLIDLADNIGDFRDTESALATMGGYYLDSLPAVLMLLLPYSLLLAVLYVLGKLSGNREIVACIQSGRGILRLTLPLVVMGLLFTLLCLGLNYHWAPYAEGGKERLLDSASGENATEARHVIYRNPAYGRLWVIGAFPPDYERGAPLRDVEVTTTDANHRMVSRHYASHARWERESRRWIFDNAVTAVFKPGEPPLYESSQGQLMIEDWPETPWQLIKPGLSPPELGVPDLNSWLATHRLHPSSANPEPYLTQWHYRWALPFACLVTVLLATPLAIHFSRRGAGGSVFMAVVLSALMMLTSSIVLAFGEAGIIQPVAAAWLPNTAFVLLAFYLFQRRLSGRPIYRSLRKVLPVGD
ncbi:MAG TPA: LptF/LptG family permease [Luteolibacter sp.]|nr:LptF/LptG family permease [Luteolibacter sp.]